MAMLFRLLLLNAFATCGLLAAGPSLADDRPARAQIRLGKWIGFLQPDDRAEALALSMDTFLVKPRNSADSPRLSLLLKVGLGGYAGAEYETQLFDDPNYDFDQGLLTLDVPENEMVVNAFVYAEPTEMKGRVFFRSTAVGGTLYLYYVSDEPGDDPEPTPPLAPALAGQYEGTCNGERAVMQIETARGLSEEAPPLATGLYQYKITGGLGIDNGRCSALSANRPAWCIDHGYSSGTYDFVSGKLFLSGNLETDVCTRSGNDLSCRVRIVPRDVDARALTDATCNLHREFAPLAPLRIESRRYTVAPGQGQRDPLPAPNPPYSRDLVAAASGAFSGYLHHESNDLYQAVRLSVAATTSTPNPHIENDVFVSVASVLFFGQGASADYWSQQYDRQILNLVAGFTLDSPQSDSFLQITRWTAGYIEGVWYSHAFGRVGTFQVAKGGWPAISPGAVMLPPISGDTSGPLERIAVGREYWDLSLAVPNQPRTVEKSYLLFQGNYRLYAANVGWPTRRITRGAYDFYSGAMGWLIDDGTGDARLVTGIARAEGLSLFWPSDRVWSVGILSRESGTYGRVGP